MKILATIMLFCGLTFAQSTEIKRPTVDADNLSAAPWITTNCGIATYQNPGVALTLAYDAAGQSTSSVFSRSSTSTANRVAGRQFRIWQTTTNTYSALTLNVNAKLVANDGTAAIAYSTDNGSNWTKIANPALAQTTYSVTLSATQDLSTLRVGVCAKAETLDPGIGTESVQLYDIWTVGTLGTAAVGGGSGAGTTIQPVQFN